MAITQVGLPAGRQASFRRFKNAVMIECYGEPSLASEIEPQHGLRTHKPHRHQRLPPCLRRSGFAQVGLKLFRPACLCLGLFGRLEERGLGEPVGKASSANAASVSSGFVPITNRRPWRVERWLGHSSEVWPDEALEKGLPRPFAKRRKDWRGQDHFRKHSLENGGEEFTKLPIG